MKTDIPVGSRNEAVWRQNIVCPEDTTQYKNVLQCPDAVSSAKYFPIDPSCSMSCSRLAVPVDLDPPVLA